MKAAFIFGYKYNDAEMASLKETIMFDNPVEKQQFFEDYYLGGPKDIDEHFIGIVLAATQTSRAVEAEELKLKPSQLRELKYIMMHIRITEPPKFYIVNLEDK